MRSREMGRGRQRQVETQRRERETQSDRNNKLFLLTRLFSAQLGYYFSTKSKFIQWYHLSSEWIFLHPLPINIVAQPISIGQPDRESSSWILFPGWHYVVSTWALRWTGTSSKVRIANINVLLIKMHFPWYFTKMKVQMPFEFYNFHGQNFHRFSNCFKD